MKSDKEVNEQVDEENQTQEGGAKKGTSNVKNYTSRYTGLGLHKIFVAMPEEEKGALRATCFAPLLLIDLIATMSTLVVEIFDRHLGDIKFQFGETIIQIKPIHVCLILGIRVSSIASEFLFVDPEHMTNFRMRRCSSIKYVKNYTIISPPEQGEKHLGERNQIEAPTIGVAATIGAPAVDTPVVVAPTVNAPVIVGDTPLLGQYQFSTSEKPRNASEKENEEKKKGKGEWQKKSNANKKNKKAEEADVALKKKVKGTKKEAFTDEKFDHVPLIQLKILIPKKGLANRVPRKKWVEFLELENIQSTA
ncbi:hypothetical protein GIB67_031830 [Kingdonia uniflora]|uniref:Uncharacterized protein n=1 Tax=Kingdonia uniflora TaxID=39325 RepID=A0A7J7L4I4_9MAGN|nr:hypothetical protein GIB67_031830 [Kingdonia uniflora]